MKIKIRGLVFAGFAAAVFAQSAMAVNDSDKTVTSKTYVDTNFQNLSQKQASGLDGESNPVTTIGDNATTDDNHYPTSRNVYLALQEIETQQGNFQRKLTNGDSKDPHIGMYVNKAASGEPADWQSEWLPIGDTTYVSVDSVYNNGVVNGVEVSIPSGKIVTTGAEIAGTTQSPGPASGDEGDLTTAKAVYEFVTYGNPSDPNDNGYQPKATSATPQVGFRTGSGTTADPYKGNWYNLGEGQDGQSLSTAHKYVKITTDNGSQTGHTAGVYLDLRKNLIIGNDDATNGDTGYDTNGITSQSGNNLATGIAVYNYSVPMNWTERGTAGSFAVANKKLVTDNSGNVVLAEDTGSVIPPESEMPQVCAEGTAVCALVAYYDADAGNGGANAGIKYEWTVMAGTGA